MRNASAKGCRENQNTRFMINIFFSPRKPSCLWDNVGKYCRAGHRCQYGVCALHAGWL